jgi:hypothetical protein
VRISVQVLRVATLMRLWPTLSRCRTALRFDAQPGFASFH